MHDRPVTLLKKGSYFGEIGLLRTARRNASVRAMTDCDLFVLTKVGSTAFLSQMSIRLASSSFGLPLMEYWHGML